MLRGLWAAYERQLASHPVPTQMATSFFLWATGDCLAQRIEHYEQRTYGSGAATADAQSAIAAANEASGSGSGRAGSVLQQQTQDSSSSFTLDRRRLWMTAGFGAGFVGPVGHYWYEGIEKVCRRLVPGGGPKFLLTKVVLDSAIMGSVYVAAFFAFGSVFLERSGLSGFVQKMKVDFIPTYAAELAIWPVVQTFNFSKVPVRHQLLVVNTFSLLDAAFISWCGNQEDWLGKMVDRLGLGAAGAAPDSKQQ